MNTRSKNTKTMDFSLPTRSAAMSIPRDLVTRLLTESLVALLYSCLGADSLENLSSMDLQAKQSS